MRNILLFSFTFLFLLAFSIPSFAYIPLTINTSTTVTLPNYITALRCINQTNIDNKTYCYYVESYDTTGYIYRFNSTFGNKSTCSFSMFGGTTMKGASIFNLTTMWMMNGYMYDISQSSFNSGTCANVTPYVATCKINYIDQNIGSWLRTTNLYYWGRSGIYNSTCGSAGGIYWDADTVPYPTRFYMPNASDTSLTYASTNQNATPYKYRYAKYSGTTFQNYIAAPDTLYGISYMQGMVDDIIKEGPNYWHYMAVESSGTLYLYKANWTLADSQGTGTTIEARDTDDSIRNTTINSTSAQMSISLNTQCNGTIMWYLDGQNIGNTTVNTAPMSAATTYYYSTGIMADGAHNWKAVFIDNCGGSSWSTNTIYFTKGNTGALGIIYTNFGSALGIDASSAKALFGMIIATAFAAGLSYYVGVKIFVPSMVGFVMVLAFIGFFPAWMTVLFVVIAGMIFAKMGGFI